MEINPQKRVIMEYYNFEQGLIDFNIITNYTNKNKQISLTFWNTWDNFDEYIVWMENVLKGNNNCIYRHDPEDVPFCFKYNNHKFFVYTWQDEEPEDMKYLIEVEIDRIDLIYELYYSFRGFINSEKYDYKLWESITFKDYLEIKYETLNTAIENLCNMNYIEIINLLNECAIEYNNEPYYTEDLFKNIENLNKNEKIEFITNVLYNEGFRSEDGLCLRKMKSEYIEEYFKSIK